MMALRNKTSEQGFSLVEFMVALLLGTILIGGSVSLYLASLRSYTESERSMGISDGARFGLMLLNDTLRHAGYMGGGQLGQDIQLSPTLDAIPPSADCSDQAVAYDPAFTLFGSDVATDGTAFGCIDDGVPDTDVLIVKHLLADPISDDDPEDPNDVGNGVLGWTTGSDPREIDPETTYVITNGEAALLIDGADTIPSVAPGELLANGIAYPYNFQVFYIRDKNPADDNDPDTTDDVDPWLSRHVLRWTGAGTGMSVVIEDLVQGVQDIVFVYGFDTDGDGLVDTFAEGDDVPGGPPVNRWNSVSVVEVYMLLRSRDKDYGYTDEKTYQMGPVTFTPTGEEQNYVRLLVSSSITLRNPRLQLVIRP